MIKRVQATNFLSWERLDFDVVPGVTLIDGWNEDDQTPEGSGKSAILNAISWCLYGKLPKDSKIDDVVKHGSSSCSVAVHFDSVIVVRSRKPNTLTMVKPDGTEVQGKDAKETQDLIEQFVGLSFDTFCQTVYFAQNYPRKFITANQEEKGKILSEVQDLTIFDKARKEVLSLAKLEEAKLTQLQHSFELAGRDMAILEGQITVESLKIDQAKDARNQELKFIMVQAASVLEEFESSNTTYLRLETEIKDLDVDERAISDTQDRIASLAQRHKEVEAELLGIAKASKARALAETQGKNLAARYKSLVKVKETNEDFIKNPTQVCPTCSTTLQNCDTSHAEEELARTNESLAAIMVQLEEISKELEVPEPDQRSLKTELSENVSKRLELQEWVNALRKQQSHQQSLVHQMNFAKSTAASKKAEYQTLLDQYSDLEKEPLRVDLTLLNEKKAKLEEIKEARETLRGTILETTAHLARLEALKDGFKEVKSFVFNGMLNEVNSRVQQYLSHLFEVPVTVKFRNDSMRIETDVVYDGAERGLGLLSGGQFRRVSLAVDLALADVITARKGATLGITIWDEYMKDLSEQSMEKVLELLSSRNQPTILIEHNSMFKNIVNNTVTVSLKDGTSEMVGV